jgi:hypothetical protein
MWTHQYWKDLAERTIRTVAQAGLATLAAGRFGLLDVDWAAVLSTTGFAGLLAVLTSVARQFPRPSDTGSFR